MKISVIIPVYNGDKYLQECLDGMMRQSHKELEVIVVNDGSTDYSADIAAQHPLEVRLITLESNHGQSVARNRGIEEATGDYIHFMDVDDAVNDEFYEHLAAAAGDTDADMACSGVVNQPYPHRSTSFEERTELLELDEKLRETNVGRWGYVWRYLFRTDFLRKNELSFEEGRLIEDMPFSLQAVYFANKVVLTPGALYTYIAREESSMTTQTREHRRRRHRDHRHAKEVRHNFARSHKFRIPGVPTSLGPLSLWFVKWFT